MAVNDTIVVEVATTETQIIVDEFDSVVVTDTLTSPNMIEVLAGSQGVPGPAPVLNWLTPVTGAAGSNASVAVTGDNFAGYNLTLTIPRGNTGATGPANTLAIGTVTTGSPGSSASSTITGTSPNQTLNLIIPRGDVGATGPAPNVSIGTVTTVAAGGSATASVTGTNPNYSLNIGIPTGATGAIPTIVPTVSVTTGAPGTSASASWSGSNPYTLSLTIPRGDPGSGNVSSSGALVVNNVAAWASTGGLIKDSGIAYADLMTLSTSQTITASKTFGVEQTVNVSGTSAATSVVALTSQITESGSTPANDLTAIVRNGIQGHIRKTGTAVWTNSDSYTRGVSGVMGSYSLEGGTVDATVGVRGRVATSTGTTVTNAIGVESRTAALAGTVTNYMGFFAANPNNSGTTTTNYGVYIERQTSATNNYGLYFAPATDVGAGIQWGTDVSLYRSGNGILSLTGGLGISTTATVGTGLRVGTSASVPADGQLRLGSTSPSIYFDRSGTSEWLIYDTGGTFYVRDLVNSRMHITMANTGATTFVGSVTATDFSGPGTSLTGVVHTTGVETVGGAKSFSALLTASNGISIPGNQIASFSATGLGSPTFTTYSAGTKVVLYDNISGTNASYTIGVETGYQYFGAPTASGAQGFKWYGGTTLAATLTGTGSLTTVGGIISGGDIQTAQRLTSPTSLVLRTTGGTVYFQDGTGANTYGLFNSTGLNVTGTGVFSSTVSSTGFSASNAGLALATLTHTSVGASGLVLSNTTTVGGSSPRLFFQNDSVGAANAIYRSTGGLVITTGGTPGTGSGTATFQFSDAGTFSATIVSASTGFIGSGASLTGITNSQVSGSAPLASPAFTGTVTGITKAMVGLGNVDNTADTAKVIAQSQVTGLSTALGLLAPLASPTFTGTVSGITKTMVGLGNVDNTADASKVFAASQITSGVFVQARVTPNTQRFIFTTGSEARPTGSTYVEWVGPVTPTNAVDGDTWVNTA